MLELEDREWKGFLVNDIFEISPGKRLTKNDMQAGPKPFIGATDSNNGITAFVSNNNASEDKDVLGVNYNGSVVENFYHPYTCIFSDDVKRFKLKCADASKYIYLFMKTVILQQKRKYAYGYKFNEKRMQKQMIILPVNDSGAPDYAFMERYIREREQQIIQKYISYIDQNIQIGGDVTPLNKKDWKDFRLLDIFDHKKGNQNNMATLADGNIPLVSARNVNNGYKAFVSENSKQAFQGHCVTINNDGDGGAGLSYYQPCKMLLDTHVTALFPKNNLSQWTLLFISNCITVQHEKFGHGYSLNDVRLSIFSVMLSVDSSGNPDWDYMERYMKRLESILMLRYLSKKQGPS